MISGAGEKTVCFENNTERTFTYYAVDELADIVNHSGFEVFSIASEKRNVRTWLDLYARKI
jgi:hypothetical protein